MPSVSSGLFTIDTRQVRDEARKWGTNAERWLMDGLTMSFHKAGHIAQHEANVLIKGGEGSKLAKASKVTTTVTGIDISTEVSWDDAVSDDGFHYAAAVDRGRKEIVPVAAKALRFEIGGEVIFARHAKAAPAQDFTGRGRAAAEPKMLREINTAVDRWAARMEAA